MSGANRSRIRASKSGLGIRALLPPLQLPPPRTKPRPHPAEALSLPTETCRCALRIAGRISRVSLVAHALPLSLVNRAKARSSPQHRRSALYDPSVPTYPAPIAEPAKEPLVLTPTKVGPRAEWIIHSLRLRARHYRDARIEDLREPRDQDGLVAVYGLSRRKLTLLLRTIDPHWQDVVEILDTDPDTARQIIRRAAGGNAA